MSNVAWLNADSRKFLEKGYLEKGVTPEQRIRQIAEEGERRLASYGYNFKGWADTFEEYMHKGWYSLSSPIWANFGLKRGLPISCNNSYVADDTDEILFKAIEIGKMTKLGSGTSAYLGALRPRGTPITGGGEAGGPVDYLPIYERVVDRISQTGVRRGSLAVYLDVEHPDIMEFLEIRESGHPIQSLSLGVCITNKWMEEMSGGDKDKRKIWGRIIKKRFESGYPYLFFTDNVNDNRPQVYKDNDMKVYSSNLCSEVLLPSCTDESFVCDLSSMNLLHWEEWKESDAVAYLVQLLDMVMEEYIEKTEGMRFMEAANKFAKRHRALGVGTLGWHSLLQSKMLPFESQEARHLNIDIHKKISEDAKLASQDLFEMFGTSDLMSPYKMRNSTLMAIAPTTSSSFILGQVSQSIEPLNSNYFVNDLAKGKFTYKNQYLAELLRTKGLDNKKTWDAILKRGGSVQHLDALSEIEKNVFKTFGEISQREIIIQAHGRQKYIDQGQSLNLTLHSNTPAKEVSELLIWAWQIGIKTLYYQRSTNPSQEYSRELLNCKACEG